MSGDRQAPRVAICGERAPAIGEALHGFGIGADAINEPQGGASSPALELAASLRMLAERFAAPGEQVVIVTDNGELAFAATLVAAKLGLTLISVADAGAAPGDRLATARVRTIAELAEPIAIGPDRDPRAVASAIVARLRS